MEKNITISETCILKDSSTQSLIQNELRITNTSSQDITNLKLIIHAPRATILEQSITRERGSLSFSPETTCLELGNLAPDESACFDYKFSAADNLTSLSPHFTLTYTDLNSSQVMEKQLLDFLTDCKIVDAVSVDTTASDCTVVDLKLADFEEPD